jgi:hypothetical protein
MIVALVDKRHIDWLVGKALCCCKTSESCAHDHGFRARPGQLASIIAFIRRHLSLRSSLRPTDEE